MLVSAVKQHLLSVSVAECCGEERPSRRRLRPQDERRELRRQPHRSAQRRIHRRSDRRVGRVSDLKR